MVGFFDEDQDLNHMDYKTTFKGPQGSPKSKIGQKITMLLNIAMDPGKDKVEAHAFLMKAFQLAGDNNLVLKLPSVFLRRIHTILD